jgi:hypothetical protein
MPTPSGNSAPSGHAVLCWSVELVPVGVLPATLGVVPLLPAPSDSLEHPHSRSSEASPTDLLKLVRPRTPTRFAFMFFSVLKGPGRWLPRTFVGTAGKSLRGRQQTLGNLVCLAGADEPSQARLVPRRAWLIHARVREAGAQFPLRWAAQAGNRGGAKALADRRRATSRGAVRRWDTTRR